MARIDTRTLEGIAGDYGRRLNFKNGEYWIRFFNDEDAAGFIEEVECELHVRTTAKPGAFRGFSWVDVFIRGA
jgi:hypothetical protein